MDDLKYMELNLKRKVARPENLICSYCGKPIKPFHSFMRNRDWSNVIHHPKCYPDYVKFIHVVRVFELLANTEELNKFLSNLPDSKRDELYSHPLLKEFDLLP